MKRVSFEEKGISMIELQMVALISIIVSGISFFTLYRSQSALELGEKMTDLQFRGRQSMEKMAEEIRLAGYGMAKGDTAFVSAKENDIQFMADVDDNGTIDTLRFSLSLPNSMIGTENPDDCILYKSINGSLSGIPVGTSFTDLTFGYFDEKKVDLFDPLSSDPKVVKTSDLKKIRLITVSLTGETKKPDEEGKYQKFVLNSSINPRNLLILASN